MRVDRQLPFTFHVFEKNHEFLKIGDDYFRTNEIWRKKLLRGGSGKVMETELVTKNFALVKYVPERYREIDMI